jgi:NADPH2:quinone reductase
VLAAAGGVGQLVTQMVKAAGGRVIGLVSRREKTEAAAAAGADHVLISSGGGFQDTVRELTGGRGADVVYDNGGTATFSSSQLALRRHGVHAFYGNLMGVPTLQPTDLPVSILLTYPQVFDHVPDQDSLRARVGDVFDLVVNGDPYSEHRPALRPGRRAAGPPRSRLAPDHRQAAAALTPLTGEGR